MKNNFLLEDLDDIEDDSQGSDFKIPLGTLVSYVSTTGKKILVLKKLNTVFAKVVKKNIDENGELNSEGKKYKLLNNECKILYYKAFNYMELVKSFYKDKSNLGDKKLFDDVHEQFKQYADKPNVSTSIDDFNNNAKGLEIIKLPNTIVTYENTYGKDVQEVIAALESSSEANKIKIFMSDFKSLLEEEIKVFLEKVKTIEGRTGEDPPEETEESSELISNETFNYFIQKATPFVQTIYKDKPMFSFKSNGEFNQSEFNNSPFSKGFEDLDIQTAASPFNITVNEPKEMANLTNSILKNNLSKDDLRQYITKPKERSDYSIYSPQEKKDLSDEIKDERINGLLDILEKISKVKTDKETADAAGRQIGFNRFLKVSERLYTQFTTNQKNYPLFVEPESDDMNADLKLTKPYSDPEYTSELKIHFDKMKETLIILGQKENIIKNRYKDKSDDELRDILKGLLKLRKLRNKEIYRDILNVETSKAEKQIDKMLNWYESQNFESNLYETNFLQPYAELYQILFNAGEQGQLFNNPSEPAEMEEKLAKLIKPLIREKLKRKQNGKKNLRN